MRDPDRLDSIYEMMAKDHKEKFPDWRMTQLMSNFLGDYYGENKRDPFFLEDDKFIKAWKDFVERVGA